MHGTRGLRVVDASVFPRIPGFFIVTDQPEGVLPADPRSFIVFDSDADDWIGQGMKRRFTPLEGTIEAVSPFAGGVHALTLQEDKSENQTPYTVTIYTSGTQATLPDLSAFGMDLPANTEFTWQIQGVGPAASLDAMIGLVEQGNPLEQGTGDLAVSTSETRTFTTAATP